jgi:ankyrin repeat protein
LLKAIANDSKEEIMRAIQSGADINCVQCEKAPLMIAILLRKINAVKCLIDNGAKPDKLMVEYAIKLNDIRNAFLLSKKCELNVNTFYSAQHRTDLTLLECAFIKNDLECVLELLRCGADYKLLPDNNIIINFSSFFYDESSLYINIELISKICDELIVHGYNINNLWRLKLNGLFTKFLLDHGANPNYIFYEQPLLSCNCLDVSGCSYTPLASAIASSDLDSVKILLDAGADMNGKINPRGGEDVHPIYPLSFAIDCGSSQEIIELLVYYGASLE